MTTSNPDSGSPSPVPPSPGFEIFNPSEEALPFDHHEVTAIFRAIEQNEEVAFQAVEIVFTDEDGIIEINKIYLQREYVTDIISFRYDEQQDKQIEGTLYCCAPRIYEQSKEFDTDPGKEFLRIIIHGLLHLAGYDDQSPAQKQQMTDLEDHYLEKVSAV